MTTITMSSREFNQNVSLAKRVSSRGPVLITDRGVPSHVLLSIKDYGRHQTRFPSGGVIGRCSKS